ncbi:MAG: YHYH domain-containing protein [Nitrospiraceae bacterium]|nr:MAG: YHYH domain-containing protein [Nitrospiraceae bacterium]
MKIFLAMLFILLMPFSAIAHPGKTDHRGGHKCWKNCGEWELRRGEYHLHDKDWNPIRLDSKGGVIKTVRPGAVPTPDKRFLQEEPAAGDGGAATEIEKTPESDGTARKTIVEERHVVNVYEESLLPLNYILLLLLAFLMLILLLYVRKKKEKE